ncbi:MAG: PQQ-binding-like beta-propeller repeat protein, partial [Bacteroidota bacterium]
PWPMYRHDPQLTGRSPSIGPAIGVVAKTLSISGKGEINSGITIDADSTMYVSISFDSLDLFALYYQGEPKWAKKNIPPNVVREVFNSPTIGNNGTLYHTTRGGIFALTSEGDLVWNYFPSTDANGLVTQIGKDGTIYFISQTGILHALSPAGELLWTLTDSRFSWGSIITPSFSVDGKTLYVQCYKDANIAAIDIETHNIKWTFGRSGTPNAPVVDAQGNIYLLPYSGVRTDPVMVDTFYSIKPDGTTRWQFPFQYHKQQHMDQFINYDPTIDKNGNIYFAVDTLYSLDHAGKVRWKYGFENGDYNYCPLVCDANGTIYVGTANSYIMAISNAGKQLWKIKIEGIIGLGYSPTIVNGRLIYSSWKSNKLYLIE